MSSNAQHTVDGRVPAPVYPSYVSRFYTSQMVVWDFFHQQYVVVLGFYDALMQPTTVMLIDASPVLEISEMAYVASVGISMSVSHLDVTKKPFCKVRLFGNCPTP